MKKPQVRVVNMRTKLTSYKDYLPIDTTSRATNAWERTLSPFFLGPIPLYEGRVSKNMENAWQFSKVYSHHVHPKTGEPIVAYWEWAEEGWASETAHRYPMGRGAKPAFAYWNGEKLDYVTARKRIYAPLYAQAVVKTDGYKKLLELVGAGTSIILRDFDGYDHVLEKLRFKDVIDNPDRKMGHAFILAALLAHEPVADEWLAAASA
jgi:hypothetical protein